MSEGTPRAVCSAQDAGGKELIPTALMQVLLPIQGLPRQFGSTTCAITRNSAPPPLTDVRTEPVLAGFIAETAAPGPAAHRGLPGPRDRQRPVRRHGPPGPRQQRGLSDLFRNRPGRRIYDPEHGLQVEGCTTVLARIEIDFLKELRWPGTVEIGTGDRRDRAQLLRLQRRRSSGRRLRRARALDAWC